MRFWPGCVPRQNAASSAWAPLIEEMAESLPVDASPPARQRLSFVAIGSLDFRA